jgi:hypothetical protein
MKKLTAYLLIVTALAAIVWWRMMPKMEQDQRKTHEIEAANANPENTGATDQQQPRLSSQGARVLDESKVWIQKHDAGLSLSQQFDPSTNTLQGSVTVGNGMIGLGEDPPRYIHQLKTTGCPLLLGEQHERRAYVITTMSIFNEPIGVTKEYPLAVTYPRWTQTTGLKTSGGLVFMKEENPVQNIGVIVPEVVPEEGESLDMFEWQIQIRMNDRASDVDLLSYAKPQYLDSSVIVLLATHPDNIPKESKVVWFKIEKNGTVSLLK